MTGTTKRPKNGMKNEPPKGLHLDIAGANTEGHSIMGRLAGLDAENRTRARPAQMQMRMRRGGRRRNWTR